MKQRITVEDLQQLTLDQQQKLKELWEPQIGDIAANYDDDDGIFDERKEMIIVLLRHYTESTDAILCSESGQEKFSTNYLLPLPSIGQMIDFLGDNWQMKLFCSPMHDCGVYKNLKYWQNDEFCDALWSAVKEVLARM